MAVSDFSFLGDQPYSNVNLGGGNLPAEMPMNGAASGGHFGVFGNELLRNPNFQQLLLGLGAKIAGPGSIGNAVGSTGTAISRQIAMQNAIKALSPPTASNMPGANSHTIKISPDKITTTTEMPGMGSGNDQVGVPGPTVSSNAGGGQTSPF
jgi:hypothetical protein